MHNSKQFYTTLLNSTQLYSTLHNSAQLCTTLHNSAQLCTTLHNSTQLFQSLTHRYTTSAKFYTTSKLCKTRSIFTTLDNTSQTNTAVYTTTQNSTTFWNYTKRDNASHILHKYLQHSTILNTTLVQLVQKLHKNNFHITSHSYTHLSTFLQHFHNIV